MSGTAMPVALTTSCIGSRRAGSRWSAVIETRDLRPRPAVFNDWGTRESCQSGFGPG